MPRPHLPPRLNPSHPKSVLGWTMQQLRLLNGWTETRVAQQFGCSTSHISRVEHGAMPSLALVELYEELFHGDGMLTSLYQAAAHGSEQARRRAGGHRPRYKEAAPGDASTFLSESIAHGTLMKPGEVFIQTWRVRNSGTVAWTGRMLERQGPSTGPGLTSSPRFLDVPDTEPGEQALIAAPLKAPTYDCTSIAYFKMINADGNLCFPDNYQLGLDILVMVSGQRPDEPSTREA